MTQKLKVGLVMPIAPIDGLDAGHWLDVKKIIVDALDETEGYEFETKIVSEGDSSGLIHKRIVQGLYNNDVVICDVSCKNPNVMFELGMRLAFDKPTIIIKDDKTGFTFDAGVIEHLDYPRDLRFSKIVEFKSKLASMVIATYEDSQKDPEHSPFLRSYGEFKSVKISETEVTETNMILTMLEELQTDFQTLKMRTIGQQINPLKNTQKRELLKPLFTLLDKHYAELGEDGALHLNVKYASDYLKSKNSFADVPDRLIVDSVEEYLSYRRFKSNNN